MNLVDELSEELTSSVGLRAEHGWTAAIQAAIELARRAGPADGPLAPDEKQRLLAEVVRRVTVPETHFFRNHAQLDFAAEHAQDVSLREGRRSRIWCAGSASGEEPYSLAMLLHRRTGDGVSARVEIVGSDLNADVVEKARLGSYTSWSFRGAPSWCYRLFAPDAGGRLRLANAEVKEAVGFVVESVQVGARRYSDRSLDVVLFRNVAIYLEAPAIAALHDEFARILRPGGLLLLGPSDPRPLGSHFEFLGYYDDAPIFARRAKEESLTSTDARAVSGHEVPRSPAALSTLDADDSDPTWLAIGRPRPSAPPEESAVEVLEALVVEVPEDPTAQRILGQVHLERGEAADAVKALRQAVFLDPTDALGRYFYALALRESGDARQALRQLANVIADLERRDATVVLSDGVTMVAELRRSAEFLEGQWN